MYLHAQLNRLIFWS